jgi:hypothetical protein
MRVVILATVLLASSSLCPSLLRRRQNPRLLRRKRLPASLTRIPSNSGSNVPSVADPRMTIVKWAATGGCAAATASVWAEKTVTRVRNGEDTVTVIMIAKATRIAIDTAIGTIEEAGIARTEVGATATTMTKIALAVA